MKIFVINIVTTTKNKELYEKVAVNEYPLIIHCSDSDRLKDILSQRNNYIKNILKTETLYNHAIYMIREIIFNGVTYDYNDFKINVKDITHVDYSEL